MGKLKRKLARIPEVLHEWIWLARYMKRYWLSIAFYIGLGLFGVLMGLLLNVAQRNLINAVTVAELRIPENIIRCIAVVVSIAVMQIFINAGASWISARINIRVVNEIREDIFKKIITSRWDSLHSYHSGDVINRLEGDVNNIAGGVIGFLPSLITRLAQFVGAFVIILVFGDPIMAIFALASAPILVFSAKPMMRIMRRHNEKMRDVNGRILSFNEEVFQNIQMVKAFDLGAIYCKNLRTLLSEYRQIRLDYTRISVVISIVMGLLGLIAGYACYGWGVYRLYINEISYGDMSLFIQLSGTLANAFSALVHLVPSAVSTATAAGRVMEITQLPSEPDADAEAAAVLLERAQAEGVEVHFRGVTFNYEKSDKTILNEVSFDVAPGQVVAFVGPSGGGKTTVLRMMLGLLRPQGGVIEVSTTDGSLTLPATESTRRLCSYVPQGNSIFSGTIESNLRAVKPDATDEELIEALKVSDAWGFVSELPETIHAVLGERGNNLSEGQLQRLSIARAILRDAPILIMDEATSALDVDTEARVLRNIMTTNPHRICLITTHRASMLEYSDIVFRVDGDGRFFRTESLSEALPAVAEEQ